MRLLLIDTCGETGSLALTEDGKIMCEHTFAPRGASAHLISGIREELQALDWPLRTIRAVSVVNGPGSFTGVRVGLAAAKGLCEVAVLALFTVSRLEVLLSAGGDLAEVAVLDAGRGEFYARTAGESDEELLLGREQLFELAAGRRVIVAEEALLASLAALQPRFVPLSAACALPLTAAKLDDGGEDISFADANYVRSARGLYLTGRTPGEIP